MHSGGRVLLGAGAAFVVGGLYYAPQSPLGQHFIAQMKRDGKKMDFNPAKKRQAMVGTAAASIGLSTLFVYMAHDKVYTGAEMVRFASRMTLLVGLLDLPHSLFEDRGIPLFLLSRGYDFLALLSIAATVNATH